jgi:hypothetical protein
LLGNSRRKHVGDVARDWRKWRLVGLDKQVLDTDLLVDRNRGPFSKGVSHRPGVARDAIFGTPLIDDAISELQQRGVELRILPCLWSRRDAVVASSLQFPIIRMRKALRRSASRSIDGQLRPRL